MNDFTKQELQYLMSCIYERPHSISPTMEFMRDKLQDLIDNYCDHEWRCFDDVDNTMECKNCGEEKVGD